MTYTIENEYILISVDTLGAELSGLYDKKNNREVLWNKDASYWRRSSPILFPNIGKYFNNEFRYKGNTYTQSQHGFARDTEFSLYKKCTNELYFNLDYNEDTLLKYPFKFRLILGYKLVNELLEVSYEVINLDEEKPMYYQIGGHPAFNCPIYDNTKRSDYYVYFKEQNKLTSLLVNEKGFFIKDTKDYILDNGYLKIEDDLFKNDAVIVKYDFKEISLCDQNRKPYLTMISDDFKLIGVWSINDKSPFISFEPWLGRGDDDNYEGSLENRALENSLAPLERKNLKYYIKLS